MPQLQQKRVFTDDFADFEIDAVNVAGVVHHIFKHAVFDRNVAAAVAKMRRVAIRTDQIILALSRFHPHFFDGNVFAVLKKSAHRAAVRYRNVFKRNVFAVYERENVVIAFFVSQNEPVVAENF